MAREKRIDGFKIRREFTPGQSTKCVVGRRGEIPDAANDGATGGAAPRNRRTKVFPATPTPELTRVEQERYKTRTMSERVNARLKNEFGASHLRVRGAAKAMAHLMFGCWR
ncbi:hypothetical protein SBA3_2700046 [Candidatus Sulfopaludibacter sp. SbA3]|nr:hypothetical protein SBA3_2700046 [Candidatus Sulfopaludibacter sp. SbA3]